jgi:hypothetical protein
MCEDSSVGQVCRNLAREVRRGFPICRPNVTYGGDGYGAVFGWTQMVRSTTKQASSDGPDCHLY